MNLATIENAKESINDWVSFSKPPKLGCVTVIWARDLSSGQTKEDIREALANHLGVSNIRFPQTKGKFIVVRYDNRRTRAFDILRIVQCFGVHARIVGG